jgi:hypothetical protein
VTRDEVGTAGRQGPPRSYPAWVQLLEALGILLRPELFQQSSAFGVALVIADPRRHEDDVTPVGKRASGARSTHAHDSDATVSRIHLFSSVSNIGQLEPITESIPNRRFGRRQNPKTEMVGEHLRTRRAARHHRFSVNMAPADARFGRTVMRS